MNPVHVLPSYLFHTNILTLSFHLFLDLSSGLFRLCFPTNFLYALPSVQCVTRFYASQPPWFENPNYLAPIIHEVSHYSVFSSLLLHFAPWTKYLLHFNIKNLGFPLCPERGDNSLHGILVFSYKAILILIPCVIEYVQINLKMHWIMHLYALGSVPSRFAA
jgi:hypothetical protein